MPNFELKLATGEKVVWEGKDPDDASRRYADCFPGSVVVAWRHYPRHGVFPGAGANIIEPGDKA